MLAILDVFLQIALRRRGPEDLPDSSFLLVLAGVLYVLAQVVLALPVYGASGQLARSVALDVALLCACLWGLLRLTGHGSRFGRTLTALLGTGTLLSMLMMPFNYWLDAVSGAESPAVVPTLGILAVVSWSLVVNGHILARALSAPFTLGLVLSVAYFFLNYLVFSQIGPAPG
jgi:hypothetical protein